VESRFFWDAVVRQPAAVLELNPLKNQTLLVDGNTLLVLDFGLDIIYGVGRLDLQGDGLSSKGFPKNLHCYSTGRHVETMRQETPGEA
jgi:hypothetical protein